MLVQNPREFLRRAHAERFAMPAFNVCNLEMARGCIEAATLERAPVILQTYPGDLAHAGLPEMAGIVKSLAAQTDVPVFLHLDHGPGFEYDLKCLQAGYSSVMYDGYGRTLQDALAETALIARAAHALGAALEGELGSFGGGSEGQGHELQFTDPEEIPMMLEAGADMIAVSVGSEHHASSRLNLELLADIQKRADAPLVLHGGSGIHPDDVREAVKLGVVKINIGHALSVAWCDGSREALAMGGDYGHYTVLKMAQERVRDEARRRLQLMGASGRA
jgi:fructose-bisphosphate aldolase, class II